MKRLFIVLQLVFLTFLTGCFAAHTGMISDSASLGAANFIYLKQNVSGTSKATYFLIFGGLSKQSLVDEAKKDLIQQNPILANQALANMAVSFKSSTYLGIIRTVKCNISADIVEFK